MEKSSFIGFCINLEIEYTDLYLDWKKSECTSLSLLLINDFNIMITLCTVIIKIGVVIKGFTT